MNETPAPARLKIDRRTLTIASVAAALILFLLGFILQALKARGLQEETRLQATRIGQLETDLARIGTQRDLALAHSKLGLVLYEVNRNNFANALARSTEFFDALREVTSAPSFSSAVPRGEPFLAMLNRRDEISADLARGDQAARQKLTEMYLQFEQALRG